MAFETKRPSPSLAVPAATNHGGLAKRARTHRNGIADDSVPWSVATHRAFVEAVMKTGINQASPSVIQQEMTLNTEAVTTERIKSKLQKYRGSKDKSLALFMKEYDDAMKKASPSPDGAEGGFQLQNELDPQGVVSPVGLSPCLGGEAAALLTQKIMLEESSNPNTNLPGDDNQTTVKANRAMLQNISHLLSDQHVIQIPIPVLSQAEKESALGRAIFHVVGILESLTEHRALISGRKQNPEMIKSHRELSHLDERNSASEMYPALTNGALSRVDLLYEREQPHTFRRTHPTFEPPRNAFHMKHPKYEDRKEDLSALTPLPFDAGATTELGNVEPVPWEQAESDCSSISEVRMCRSDGYRAYYT